MEKVSYFFDMFLLFLNHVYMLQSILYAAMDSYGAHIFLHVVDSDYQELEIRFTTNLLFPGDLNPFLNDHSLKQMR